MCVWFLCVLFLSQDWFNLDIRTNTEVVSINRSEKQITVKRTMAGSESGEDEFSTVKYDKLILATGAQPVRPPIPGIDLEHVYTLRTLQDLDKVERFLSSTSRVVNHATIVGAGFIGLELAENLHRRGLKVAIVERADQVLLNMDKEMTKPIRVALEKNGIELRLEDSLESIAELDSGRLQIKYVSSESFSYVFVLFFSRTFRALELSLLLSSSISVVCVFRPVLLLSLWLFLLLLLLLLLSVCL
jgi:NAD(P)H-nitrite reductase large subunit